MIELKFTPRAEKNENEPACGCAGSVNGLKESASGDSCCASARKADPAWVTGTLKTTAGSVRIAATELTKADYLEHFKCRTTSYRNDYTVEPGLYAVGTPDKNSDVLVSANYKYSFDMLRRELKGLSAWLLVLDTKGINVWCAAGKGTFGTKELVERIAMSQLDKVVEHRTVIVPQLGAPGVSAFRVRQATGFRVLYGPVYAKDLPAYIQAGHKAAREMRRVTFSLADRLILTPMEINPAMKKFPLFALIILIAFGLTPSGILFKDALTGGLPFLLLGLLSVLAGAFLTPLLLPYIPFRSFAIKGWVAGLLSIVLATKFVPFLGQKSMLLLVMTYLFFPLASSYLALQFTGSTTFTGMSGVKKELKIAMPVYIFACAISTVLLIFFKMTQWKVI